MHHKITFTLIALPLLCLLILAGLWLAAAQPVEGQPSLTFASAFTASSSENVELVGQMAGASYAVFVAGNYAYVGVGTKVVILNVTNPASANVVGQTSPLPGIVQDLTVSGNYAYVAAGSGGLRVINIANPANPIEVGHISTPDLANGVAVENGYAYVAADRNGGLRVIDISNPASPQEVASVDTQDASGVAIANGYAYVADWSSGLRVIDIANPSNPQEVGLFDTPGLALDVTLSGNYAYIADHNSGMRIVNISNPTNPQNAGVFETGYVSDVAIVGNYAYVTSGGLEVVDISNLASPKMVGFYSAPGSAEGVAVANGYAYVADWTHGLQVVDISTPTNPTLASSFDTQLAYSVAVSGVYAYLAGNHGLLVINVSNPTAAQQVGYLERQGYANSVAVAGNYAYVAGYRGLQVIDISTPSSPQAVGLVDTAGNAHDVAVAGNYAYVADWNAGLRVIDISNPATPQEVGFVEMSGLARGVAVAGGYAYVAAERSLRVINISNPLNPQEVGVYEMLSTGYDVAVLNNYAYVAAYSGGLRVVEISNPANPQEVGTFDTPGLAQAVSVADGYAYIADKNAGLRVIDISNPTSPREAGFYDTPGEANSVAAAGAYAYLSDYTAGMLILRYREPEPTATPTNTPTNTPIPTNTRTNTPIPTNTQTNTPIPTNTPSPSNTPTPTATRTPTITPTPILDAYEPDDTCAEARPIPTDGTIQTHTFHKQADDDWVTFQVTQGMTYTIEARVPPASRADLIVEVSEGCNQLPQNQGHVFTPDVRYKVVPESDGQIYVHLFNENALVYGADVTYDLSVRAEDGTAQHGALIIVAGKYKNDDPVQPNIHHVTNEVYKLFRSQGHPAEQIYYLATNELDADGDGVSDVDQFPTASNLQAAITKWAAQHVGQNRALTLFMMDHGSNNNLYLDETRRERVSPSQLDTWLNELEANTGAKVNVIIEACQSGSFIDRDENLNKEGRVVITASDALAPTYASEYGAIFSDALLSALAQRKTLQVAFDEARWATEEHPYAKTQRPLLNSDGNYTPNQPSDEAEAARRGFAITGTFADNDPSEQWPPYIRHAEIRDFAKGTAQIWADVLDDEGFNRLHVWAVIYPPSYEPPKSSSEIVPAPRQLSLAQIGKTQTRYGAEYDAYPSFHERGEYRIVIYAEDDDGLLARPKEIVLQTAWELYLPLLLR